MSERRLGHVPRNSKGTAKPIGRCADPGEAAPRCEVVPDPPVKFSASFHSRPVPIQHTTDTTRFENYQ
jgi:hypothetical protein